MHNLKGRTDAKLDTFGGTITLADPTCLPEGASPRNTNMDFNVGSTFTRNGLFNPFVYQGAAAGPSPGGTAADFPLPGGSTWANVTNVLTNVGTFATTSLTVTSSVVATTPTITQTGPNTQPWSFLSSIVSPTGAAGVTPNNGNTALITVQATIPSTAAIAGIIVSFNAFTSYSGTFAPAVASFTFGGTPKTQAATGPSTLQPYSLGSATDTWGTTFTPANFASGVTLSVVPVNGTADVLFVGGVTVQIFYNNTSSDAINIEQFGFSVPSSATPQGFQITVLGFASAAAMLNVQMLKAGSPVGNIESVPLNVGSPTTVPLGGHNDLFGTTWAFSDLNNTSFGVQLSVTGTSGATVSLGYTQLTAFFLPIQENFNYITTYEDDFGTIRNIALDAAGQFYVENVSSNPGVLTPVFSGPPANSFASSFTADSRQYIAISDLLQGNYPPQQYNGQWNDRVSQVGPGAPPTFSAIAASGDTFAIASITQPAAHSMGFSYFLQSAGPGSTTAGNVVTIYYADSTVTGPDTDLVAAFNSGFPVYVYTSFTGGPATQGPYVVQVTSVNLGQPPGQPRQFYYFTYNLPTSAFTYYQGSGHSGYTANWQRSLATLTMTVPVPGLVIGNQITITGASVPAWDSLWTITQSLNSGSFTINLTSVTSGVATYDYSLISGIAPAAGELVTVTGTTNADGNLNVVNAVIVSSTGGSSGNFTVDVSLPDFVAAAESGQAVTAGSIFAFDPGAADVGSSTNPIFGNSTGGSITFGGNSQFITAGTRKGSVFFITRNGFWTAPAPPATFTCPSNTTAIQASNLPIGPPNVIARGVIFTEAGANNVPGASFYFIDEPISYIVNGITYSATSTRVNDNTTTSALFAFPDAELLDAQEVDIQGDNLFNLGELGNAAWCASYAGRAVYGRVQTKIQNFVNLTFDGGFLANPGSNLLPLGWNLVNSTVPAGSPPTLLNSPVFGNSYYMLNVSGSTQATFSMIYQAAYQDINGVPILQNQTAYSVRVTARTPSSGTAGNLVVDLAPFDVNTGFGTPLGSFVLPLASISSTMATYTGTLLVSDTINIPSDLVIRIWGQNIATSEDIEIDRIEVYPTIQPTNLTQLSWSYVDDLDSFDLVTGGTDTTTVNTQPANGGFTMHDLFYVLKESSLGYLSDSPGQEPANWNPFKEVSNVAGAAGINAYDVGEEWAVMGCQNGLFLFNGGAPIPINLEIPDIWQAINWKNAGHTICIRNDVANRKILCAIPLATPNPWVNTSIVNSNPLTPNVILALDYKGIGTIEQLMQADAMHITMMGKMAVHDMRRKWSLWTIPTPYIGGQVKRGELYTEMFYCNGIASSKIYTLTGPQGFDDGTAFTSSYCTYGFVDKNKETENPIFGGHNKRYAYFDLLANGSGTAALTFYQNVLQAPYPYVVPGGVTLSSPAANDIEGPLNEYAQRLFVEIVMSNGWFNLSRLDLVAAMDKWAVLRGF